MLKMKILLLLTDLFDVIGGIQTFNRCFIKALDELSVNQNIHVKVLVLNDRGKSNFVKEYIKSNNIDYVFFSGNKIKFSASALRECVDVDKIIFGHVNFSPIVLFMNLFNPKAAKYLIVHGVDVWSELSFLKKLGVKVFDLILSVSTYTKNQMQNHNSIMDEKFTIFPNTLDPVSITKSKHSKKQISLKGKTLLSVTRLDPRDKYKNIDLVIKSLPSILKQVPNVNYIIIGDGEDRKRLELLVKELSLENNVHFIGYVDDDLLYSYYESSDVFVLLSTGEGFGIVFLEAMLCSKPCIGANAGGIPEVIEDRKTGLLIDPSKLNFLSASVIELLKNENMSALMGKMGKERFEKEFSFDRFKARLENVLYR